MGDLWKKVESAVTQRGPGTTRVTKVKGHATEDHIKKSITTRESIEGNNIADHLAIKACDCYPHAPGSSPT